MNKREWLIKARGKLTQEQAALLCGINRSTYSNIELGIRNPSVSKAKQIGKALKVDWQLFFDEKCHVSKQIQTA